MRSSVVNLPKKSVLVRAKANRELRENVTSPGGTTEAALKILMHNDVFKTLVETAMRAAEHRGEELSSN